jgi:hypothetical protein
MAMITFGMKVNNYNLSIKLMAMPAHSMNQIIQKIVQSIPAWPAGEKILPIMKLIM